MLIFPCRNEHRHNKIRNVRLLNQYDNELEKQNIPENKAVAVDAESHTCLSTQYVYLIQERKRGAQC